MARPPKPINWDIVEKRMEAGNKARDIAMAFNIDINNFYDRFKKEYGCSFGDYAQPSLELGKSNILYTQYMKALAGSVPMLTWLGKVICGQREPELLSSTPPLQNEIDKDHIIMTLQHQIAELRNANKPEAGSKLL